jgi:hypothetical protein
MVRAVPLVVVALLLLVSGCSSPLGGESTTDTPVTPAAVPEDRGVDQWHPDIESGDSMASLLESHRSILNGSSYRFTFRHTGLVPGFENRTANYSTVGYAGANRSRYFLEDRWAGGYWAQWSNRSVTLRHRRNETTVNTSVVPRSEPPFSIRNLWYVESSMEDATVRSISEVEDGYLVTGTLDGELFPAQENLTVERTSVSAHVTRAGLLDRYEFRFTVTTRDGTRLTGTDRVTFDLTADRLPRPAWVERALVNRSAG